MNRIDRRKRLGLGNIAAAAGLIMATPLRANAQDAAPPPSPPQPPAATAAPPAPAAAPTPPVPATAASGTKPPTAEPLPPVTVETTEKKKRAAAPAPPVKKPVPVAAPAPAPAPAPAEVAKSNIPPNANPYADPAAPYKANTLASIKFAQPIVDTPKTVTVLTKEVLEDKGATELKELGRTTAGVTLGTGEGGNAFGDRFFIRGFDARNDVFLDGVRDPGVSIRENFFTEQVEILRGPASSFAGRGTAGGAINIVIKAPTDQDFVISETTFGTDATKRETLDVNRVVSPGLSIRVGGLLQEADIAGRSVATDDRKGAFVAVKLKPTDDLKITSSFVYTDLSGIPDFGVPYYRPSLSTSAGGPFPEFGTNRDTFYGFANRDFQEAEQLIGTVNAEWKYNDSTTVNNRFRLARSTLDYIGTIPESPCINTSTASSTCVPSANPAQWTLSANPQSRYQVTDVIADQTDVSVKWLWGSFKNTTTVGTEISNESISIDSYNGLTSETIGVPSPSNSGTYIVNVFNPQYTNAAFPNFNPTLTGDPQLVSVDTRSVYLLQNLNYKNFIILDGGIRYDDYSVSSHNHEGGQSVDSGLVNYNAGIVVKPIPTASLYAAFATSSNPVGAELDATGSAYGGLAASPQGNPNQVFGPERNTAYEIGTKLELFERKMLLTAALFQTEKDNARETYNPVGGVKNTVVAGASYEIKGIDIGVAGKLTDAWSVFGGLVIMQSDVLKSNTPSADPALYASNVGRPLANIAHQSFNLLSKYQVTSSWEVGGQATYMSKIYGGTLAANSGAILPDHWRFDAFTEYKLNEHFTAKLSVNDILNTTYYDAFYRSTAPFVMEAPGRAGYFTLISKF